jgi:hypothetical protein
MQTAATITSAMLTGQSAKLLTVSGVITTPSWMPITAKQIAGKPQRHSDRPPQQRRGGDAEDRSANQSGGKTDGRERRPAGKCDKQRLGGLG